MTEKIVYIGTTDKCSACKCMKSIMKDVQLEDGTFDLKVMDYSQLPDYIKNNVLLEDFPITVFIKDEEIKYHFSGTMSKRKIKNLMEDINF